MKSIEEMMKGGAGSRADHPETDGGSAGKLDKIEVEGVSGGGLVKVRASAKGRIISLAIDDSLIVPSDKQMLEDLVVAAFNDAREKADTASNSEMGKMTSGLPLPPASNCPFEAFCPAFLQQFAAMPLNREKSRSY
jgi:DNA-binding YbaB/EbfC family protein